ncbi:hypothetical protein VF12_32180 [Nostoc linckia z15]|nr:hypothetical protein VF12_32180 [Nostoc linckia z15]
MGEMGEMGRWGDGEMGKRLKGKGINLVFPLYPLPFTLYPFPFTPFPLPFTPFPFPMPHAQKLNNCYKRMTIVLIEIF